MAERISDLYIRKSTLDPLLSWLEGWNSPTAPEAHPFIIVGESGWGKSTISKLAAEATGFHPTISEAGFRDKNQLKKWFGQVRSLSFEGLTRLAILDDASFLKKAEWNYIADQIKTKAFPLVICAQTEADIPWPIRRGSPNLKLERPNLESVVKYLQTIEPNRNDLGIIAKAASSFRAAKLLLQTTPENLNPEASPRIPSRTGFAEVQAILSGNYPALIFDSHPLSILQTAHHNGASPTDISRGIVLQGMSWKHEGLTPIASAYLCSLRTKTCAKPPFRKRK